MNVPAISNQSQLGEFAYYVDKLICKIVRDTEKCFIVTLGKFPLKLAGNLLMEKHKFV